MPARALWVVGLLAAALADAAGAGGLAFWLVLAGVAGGAAAALQALAELVDEEGALAFIRFALAAAALLLVLAAAVLRAPYVAQDVVPAASSTAVLAAIALLALDALLAPLRRAELEREPVLER